MSDQGTTRKSLESTSEDECKEREDSVNWRKKIIIGNETLENRRIHIFKAQRSKVSLRKINHEGQPAILPEEKGTISVSCKS